MARQYSLFFLLAALWFGQLQAECEEGTVRLVDGPAKNCGRVEVCHENVWGTICDDSWDYRDANVVCKQLGYELYELRFLRAYYGEGQGPIWLDNMRCSSNDRSVSECDHAGWGVHNCEHDEDASLCCKRTPAPKPDTLPVRLMCPPCNDFCQECPENSTSPTISGIVEVQVEGVWGPITAQSEYWTVKEASVVCGQLGYSLATPSYECRANYILFEDESSGSGDLLSCTQIYTYELEQLTGSFAFSFLQELECSGKETEIRDCFFIGIGRQLPNPSNYCVAAVKCSSPRFPSTESALGVRLRGSPVPWKGRVEVYKDGEWGTVCDRRFDTLEGNVVCRWLGYGTVKTIYGRGGFGRGAGIIHYSECSCSGLELTLHECECLTGYRAEQCKHRGDVGVECNVREECITTSADYMKVTEFLSPNPRAAWLIRHFPMMSMDSNSSAIFCPSVVTKEVGEVICRQTKGQFLARQTLETFPYPYDGQFYSGYLKCSGEETHLSECKGNVFLVNHCAEGYGTVDCSTVAADLVPDVKRLKSSLHSRYHADRLPMYYLDCAHEEECLSSSADTAPQNSDRFLLRFDSAAYNWGLTDFVPSSPPQDWIWHSCHNHFHSMEEFAHYDLIDEDTGEKVAEGHKASFCLEDSLCEEGSGRYRCSFNIQGISSNCADLYPSHLDCQWIDVTGVSVEGDYLLQVHLNPSHLAVESDYKNNMAVCQIRFSPFYGSMRIHVGDCWLSDH